jgi:predicted Zn-dependent protease
MRGDITGAEAQFDDMEARLSKLTDQPPPLRAVARALRSEVAYEMNDLDGSAQLLNDALQSAEDTDAWFDVLASAYRVNTRLAFARAGLPGALTALAHAEHIARERSIRA